MFKNAKTFMGEKLDKEYAVNPLGILGEKIIQYQGHKLIESDYNALESMINLVGDEPEVKKGLEWNDYAIIISENRIIGLSIYNKGLVEIPKQVSKLDKLEELYLFSNHVRKLEGLGSLMMLKDLRLGANELVEIKGLNKLTKLECLYFNINQITRIENLDSLTKLKLLILDSNKISKIEGLKNLENLEELRLNYNFIIEIEGLVKLTSLKKLYLQENQVDPNDLKIKELSDRGVEVYV